MPRMTESHLAMTSKQQSFISTNITIVFIHSVQNCRNMIINYVLHPYDMLTKNAEWKRIKYQGILPWSPFKRGAVMNDWSCETQMSRWNELTTMALYRILQYRFFYEPINFNPCNALLQRPDKHATKKWNLRTNHNVYRKTVQMKQLYRRRSIKVNCDPKHICVMKMKHKDDTHSLESWNRTKLARKAVCYYHKLAFSLANKSAGTAMT